MHYPCSIEFSDSAEVVLWYVLRGSFLLLKLIAMGPECLVHEADGIQRGKSR